MSETQPEIWKGSALTIARDQSKGAVVLHFSGPFTSRDMYNTLTPDILEEMFKVEPGTPDGPTPRLILDLSQVPYMDSMGLGVVVTQYVRLKNKGVHLIAAATTPHVLELLKLTHLNTVLPMAASVEEAVNS